MRTVGVFPPGPVPADLQHQHESRNDAAVSSRLPDRQGSPTRYSHNSALRCPSSLQQATARPKLGVVSLGAKYRRPDHATALVSAVAAILISGTNAGLGRRAGPWRRFADHVGTRPADFQSPGGFGQGNDSSPSSDSRASARRYRSRGCMPSLPWDQTLHSSPSMTVSPSSGCACAVP